MTHEPSSGDRSDLEAGSGPSPSAQADAMGSTILAYLLTGPALFGGLAWLLSEWTGVTFFLPIGILVGMALSLYIIWLRYGKA